MQNELQYYIEMNTVYSCLIWENIWKNWIVDGARCPCVGVDAWVFSKFGLFVLLWGIHLYSRTYRSRNWNIFALMNEYEYETLSIATHCSRIRKSLRSSEGKFMTSQTTIHIFALCSGRTKSSALNFPPDRSIPYSKY